MFWLCAFFPVLILWSCKKDPVDTRIVQMDPEETARQAKDIEGTIKPEIAEGLTLQIWGGG
jgi:hypothetical protein